MTTLVTGPARIIDLSLNSCAVLFIIFLELYIFIKLKIKLNVGTKFGFALNTLALVVRLCIDFYSFLSDDYRLDTTRRWLYCFV